MINQIFVDNDVLFLGVFLAMISGLSVRISLSLAKQKWASTYHHTMSYILLPLITLIITVVISGNIALSLGMIGALSIVRFRTPVKNPFELVIFFALITIGISMAVNVKYGVLLATTIDVVILLSYLIEVAGKKFGFHTYSLSFEEGNSQNIIEISASDHISFLDNNKFLLQYTNNKSSGEIHYRLASKSREDIEKIRLSSEGSGNILSIELRFS
jgi:hypothetical protein